MGNMKNFPFPDRVSSREELKRDILYRRIPAEERTAICDTAWDIGVRTAKTILKKSKNDIRGIIASHKLDIKWEDTDKVVGNIRFFGEYLVNKNLIVMYTQSIAKWAKENGISNRQAQDLILAHEFFHFLEVSKIGSVSDQYSIPVLKIGSRVLLYGSIKALSEIGAHGFSRTYFDLYRNRMEYV